jgi:hypothetical protein
MDFTSGQAAKARGCFVWFLIVVLVLLQTNISIAEEIIIPIDPVSTEPHAEEEVYLDFPADSDTLASGYIQSALPKKPIFRVSRPSGLRLLEPNRSLYTAIKTRISAVAAGQAAETAFSIPASEVFPQTRFTAEDLELTGPLINDQGQITREASNAFHAKLSAYTNSIDFPAILNCLMADCPYELYWFNKSYLPATNDFRMGAVLDQQTGHYTKLVIIGNYDVTLHVSQDYAAATTENGSITYSRTTVDSSYGQSVARAAENAQGILEQYSSCTDYEKLCGYKDSICALADYNHEAAGVDIPYGDPWQLVWVFDGKPNTKVVCEGYAKAFQYLCDLGTTKAVSIQVQGYLNSTDPKNAHMWNIVTIDGRNYLADVTNCDAGMDLFLKGYSDGSADSGYYISNGSGTTRYIYNRAIIERAESELTLSRWDYSPESTEGVAMLPAGLTEIGGDAFGGTKLESFRMTEDVTEIAGDAFSGMENQIVIFAPSGSYAGQYAAEKGIRFEEK